MGKLTNQVAVVTGASKGIGAGIAKAFAAEGASVVVNYATSKEGADRVVQEITANGGKAIAVQGDVSKQADITRLFAETKKAYGKLNILVNNAGVYDLLPLEAVTEEQFHKHFNLNVLGLLLTTKEAVKLIGPEGGSIINIGSGVSTLTPPNSSVYTATKGAVDAITGESGGAEKFVIPAVVFTDPEVAWCGLTESEAKQKGIEIKVAKFPWAASGRAVSFDRTDGLTKLVIDPETEQQDYRARITASIPDDLVIYASPGRVADVLHGSVDPSRHSVVSRF